MTTLHRTANRSILTRRAALLLALSIAWGCASSGGKRPAQTETRDENGFTITEGARASARVRSDFEKAMRLLEEEDYQGGIALLVEVTETAPDLATPHIDLGIAYGKVGELESAKASFERALALNPRHPVARNELGILYRRMGRFEEARMSYEALLADYPNFHFARRNLAILCDVYLADLSCAIEHYELYSEAMPDDENAAMWIADLRNRAGGVGE